MAETIQVLVVDDHPVVREGLVAILGTQSDIDVIGEAGDGKAAVDQALALKPDVILLDLEMPEVDGLETLDLLNRECPDVPIIVFTAFDTDERILAAVKAGARGYLLKGVPRQELFNAIRIVHGGGSLLQPIVASKLMRQVRRQPAGAVEQLTARETEVLALLAKGLQNKEIAARLSISERTVKFHVSAILGKLGVDNRTEAVATAMRRGLVELEDN